VLRYLDLTPETWSRPNVRLGPLEGRSGCHGSDTPPSRSSASYTSSGTTISAFQGNPTLVHAILRHDLAVRHPESVAVKTGITWGA